jgi:hypothetical protein
MNNRTRGRSNPVVHTMPERADFGVRLWALAGRSLFKGGGEARARADEVCRGWSDYKHWMFFKKMLTRASVRSVCVLGVYYGRDIAYLGSLATQLRLKNVRITGVDKFEDKYCEDWPAELRHKTWSESGFGPAPRLDLASANIETLGLSGLVNLVSSLDWQFLANTEESFDMIYIDTSHDYESVSRLIELSMERCSKRGLIAGDDYSDKGTWGVKRAVSDSFRQHRTFGGKIWYARPADFQARVRPAAHPGP